MKNNAYQLNIYWKELDLLRGCAALMMVVNHVGYKTLDANIIDSIFPASMVFIGSFAPVLFFFVTGVGYGIQSSQRKKGSHWDVTLNKVVVLILADLLMPWSEGRWLGLDFLGFIAVSSLVLEFVRSSRAPIAYCIAGFASVSLMRYLLGPFIHSLGYDRQAWGVLGTILGTSATPGVSYPLSPWLAYPFAGYLVGVAAVRYRDFIETRRLQVVSALVMLAGFPLLAGIIMAQRGFSFFRWGTVALGFYVVSFAALSLSLAGCLAVGGEPGLKNFQNALSLKGVASLAVVPAHYFLLYLLESAGIKGLDFFSYCLVAVAVSTASFLLARSVEILSHISCKIPNQRAVWLGFVAMFLLAAGLTLIFSRESTYLVMVSRTFGQLVLCLLLVIRWS